MQTVTWEVQKSTTAEILKAVQLSNDQSTLRHRPQYNLVLEMWTNDELNTIQFNVKVDDLSNNRHWTFAVCVLAIEEDGHDIDLINCWMYARNITSWAREQLDDLEVEDWKMAN